MLEALARANFDQDVAALTDRSAVCQRLTVHARTFPILDVTVEHSRPIRLRMHADNWDDLPPSIDLLRPDGAYLTEPLPGGIFNGSAHPGTGRFFICMRGVREFHSHQSHIAERWENYRGQDGMGLVGILVQVANNWRQVTK